MCKGGDTRSQGVRRSALTSSLEKSGRSGRTGRGERELRGRSYSDMWVSAIQIGQRWNGWSWEGESAPSLEMSIAYQAAT